MNFSVNLLDQLVLDFSFESTSEGIKNKALYLKFPDRPQDPHVSLQQDARDPIHFTAGSWKRRPYRRRIAPVTMKQLEERVAQRLGVNLGRHLVPFSPLEWQHEGWLGHYVDWRAIARWLAPVCVMGRVVQADEAFFMRFVAHVYEHHVPLARLEGFPDYAQLVAVNWENVNEPRMRAICNFPKAFALPGGGEVSAGWHWTPTSKLEAGLPDVVPEQLVSSALARVTRHLERFPRSKPAREFNLTAPYLLGCYCDDLLRLAAGLAVRSLQRPASLRAGVSGDGAV